MASPSFANAVAGECTDGVKYSASTQTTASASMASMGGDSVGTDMSGTTTQPAKTVIYHTLSVDVDGARVPVAAWHPSPSLVVNNSIVRLTKGALYEHRISVSKIAKNLAGWNLPSFVDRDFSLEPTLDGRSCSVQTISLSGPQRQLPESAPVVLLAHGFLGSRFDLSHLGEALAGEGFLVLAPEYPESLAASYDAKGTASGLPLDRTIITDRLLQTLTKEWNVQPTSYGIVGHSLGCGTVDKTGDETWTRVCLAGGYPSLRGTNSLFIGSVNDGAVGVTRSLGALQANNFASIDEEMARSKSYDKIPSRSSLIFTDPDNAPNHISFLSEGTNDAMISFLSPLLPLASLLSIPVLDFDKYKISRDSKATGEVVIPLVVSYLKQKMVGDDVVSSS